jgi:hypothetical protein
MAPAEYPKGGACGQSYMATVFLGNVWGDLTSAFDVF